VFSPGCGSGEEVTIIGGCYRPCSGATDTTSCPAPTICRRTDVNPCECPPGEACCDACGAEQWLCLAPGGGTEPYEIDSLDESCEGVVTGRQILDAIAESYTAGFSYIDGTAGTTLSLTFTYESGTLLCHPAIPAPPGSGAPDLPAYLDVEVTAGIATADGAFDEATTATLTAYAPGASVELRTQLDAASLTGAFEPRLSEVTSHVITFGGQLMGTTTSGSAVEGGMRSTGVGETLGVGSWMSGG
jgi:hypothetical protein